MVGHCTQYYRHSTPEKMNPHGFDTLILSSPQIVTIPQQCTHMGVVSPYGFVEQSNAISRHDTDTIMTMASGKQGKSGPFARAISSEIRAAMGRQRLSGAQLAPLADVSANYLAKRLRDDVSFTINDIEAICAALGEDMHELLELAYQNLPD